MGISTTILAGKETELNSNANKDKWAFVFKKQGFGVSGWKVAKRK